MVGGGPILADELLGAQRGLDYMLTSIQNKNVLLHKIETTTVPISASVSALTFDHTVVDVLSASLVYGTITIVMGRDGFQRWAELPTKSQTGRPTRFWFDRQRDHSDFNVWPLPDTTYSVILTIQKSMEDTVRAFNTIDVPRRFLPALLYGLAYFIGLRRPGKVPDTRLQILKMEYEKELQGVMREDRERGPFLLRIGR